MAESSVESSQGNSHKYPEEERLLKIYLGDFRLHSTLHLEHWLTEEMLESQAETTAEYRVVDTKFLHSFNLISPKDLLIRLIFCLNP